jgi:cyclopropane fatty-acyl-phospholipid synthase-like methyltransferase
MRWFSLVCAFFGCAHSPAPETHGHHHGHMPHHFDNATEWAKTFEAPDRDAWQKPDEVIAALKLAPDAVVADIGAATGYFPVRIARSVPKGRVYGVDIEQSMVDYLTARAKNEGVANLTAVLGSPDDPKLPEPVDLVLVVDTYHHIENRPAYFERLASKLKPGGRLAIVDFRKGQPMGPPEEMRIDLPQLKDELAKAGYSLAQSFDFLPNQYFVVFAR